MFVIRFLTHPVMRILVLGALGVGLFFFWQSAITDLVTQQNNELQRQIELTAQNRILLALLQQEIINLQGSSDARAKDLQDRITRVQASADASASSTDYSAVVAQWQNRIARVSCTFSDGSTSTGAGTITSITGYGLVAVTNAHVITDEAGSAPRVCTVRVSGLGERVIRYSADNPQFFDFIKGGLDLAYIRISTPESATDNGAFTIQSMPRSQICSETPQLGDKLVILGYPWDGSQSGITATQGVVSGFDGKFYVTDAKIDQGNSGGAAILLNNRCWLGIPSAAVVGFIESYGRILRGNLVFP